MAGWRYYRAVALDLDGTIARGGPPEERVLAAIATARAQGIQVVLVTGRILAELEADFPGLATHFDAVCAENGGVLAISGTVRPLARRVDRQLEQRLLDSGVGVRAGQVLLACDAGCAHVAIDAIHDLQLDAQLVRNREQLMILPAGVTKGRGLVDTLGELGISPHSAIAVGDAENDHALLETSELGVAVANAVDALAAHADLILPAPNGTGVAQLMVTLTADGGQRLRSDRWRLQVGTDEQGLAVTIPASQTTILVTGEPGSGKSYLTGLIAEQLIGLGYATVVIDPEGDHTELGMLHNVLVFGSTGGLPAPAELVRFLRHDVSVVADLSLLSEQDTAGYVSALMRLLERHRRRFGVPHWIVLDEAHQRLGRTAFPSGSTGYCLATYRPEHLTPGTVERMDWRITVAGPPPGEAVLHAGDRSDLPAWFEVADRATDHVRHQHKYTDTDLPYERGFHFRRDSRPTGPTGAVAVNLRQFLDHLQGCDPAEIRHHATGRDLSRWIHDVHRDPPLADHLRRLEGRIAAGAELEPARRSIVDAVARRYGLDPKPTRRDQRR